MAVGPDWGWPDDQPQEIFKMDLFEDLIIDVTFLHSIQLHQFIQDENLDKSFALATTTIYMLLKEFKEGYYTEILASSDNWRDPYLDVTEMISTIWRDHQGNHWLTELQQLMVTKGRLLHACAQTD